MALTSFARTVDALLQAEHGVTLAHFIDHRRARGASFAEIAEDLNGITGGTVDVTRTTIANWTADLVEAVA